MFVCDPNNPTGLRIGRDDWDAFIAALPDRCLAVVDEAYADYIEPSTDRPARRHRRRPAGGRAAHVLEVFGWRDSGSAI